MNEYLTNAFNALNLEIDAGKLLKYETYCTLLLEMNKVMNLTAITEPEQVYIRHFVDSVNLLACADFRNKSVIDVGSGAGFPGLALKIAEPTISLTLLDSHNKRVKFLSDTAEALGLQGVSCVHARAEEHALKSDFRDSFDIAVSRAVAELAQLTELTLPFVATGGLFLAMKAPDADDEISRAQTAITSLGGRLKEKRDYNLFGETRQNSVVIIEKIAETPKGFPRRYAKIKKHPL